YDVGRRAGIDAVDNVARMLGLGEPTGIEIFEAPGQRSNPGIKMAQRGENWYEGDILQTSIGQLFNQFTPLQLANYFAAIANRGKRMELTLVHEIRDYSQENVVRAFEPRVAFDMAEYIPPEMFDPVIRGLVSASLDGTAIGTFGNYPVPVASKTGTPQVTADILNSTFLCFAPADDPQVAVAVVIERGGSGILAAPVAKSLLDAWFGFEDVVAWNDSGPRRLQLERLAEIRALEEAAAQSAPEDQDM
ncbi:MAG: penicillin-binding transpeptidase domain-containing protein, partial [Oscillospiraceae bacterium]|nr:penicillin-binding transpeptidase domain-containing protein [Oscillospiraceae bacterium]